VSDRLEELRRQRALQREHLDWIEREIAALEAAARQEEPAGQPPEIGAAARDEEDPAEAILREYALPPDSIERRTKLGCFLYFGIALAILALGLAAVYLHARAGRVR
jgi:hypothetical protein